MVHVCVADAIALVAVPMAVVVALMMAGQREKRLGLMKRSFEGVEMG